MLNPPQMKNSFRHGLFHPNDIKTVGLGSSSPGPKTAPLPSLSRRPSRPSLNPLPSPGPSSNPTSRGHSRSSSFASPPNGGSFGRADARRLHSQPEFIKYTEDDEEDYDDIFGKPNGTCESAQTYRDAHFLIESSFTTDADPPAKHSLVGQVMGKASFLVMKSRTDIQSPVRR